jgi:hypothetical protein
VSEREREREKRGNDAYKEAEEKDEEKVDATVSLPPDAGSQ